ncbi:Ltp family lipoprotein [Xiamenia xianingshaonis]|uniref:Ltp family lipoprotein n=1 Tax=Xiamenia xianingshaonis TaxID=2682776 RepID=UPI00140B971B|nr:Ltp family lipoprotein [Xiamenia xianingshaonis]
MDDNNEVIDTQTNSKKKKAVLISVVSIIGAAVIVVAVLFATHVICFHDWAEAACETPETCTICNRIQGESLGHDIVAATCTTAETCTRCGEVFKPELGHDTKDATCLDSEICMRCKEEFGSPLGHDVETWNTEVEPTCTSIGKKAGKCTRCSRTIEEEIEMIPHAEGEWEITKDYNIETNGTVTPGEKVLKCANCGAAMKTAEYTIELTTGQKNAIKTAVEYCEWLHPSYQLAIDWMVEQDGYTTDDATFGVDHCGADWKEQAALNAKSQVDYGGASEEGLREQLGTFYKFTEDEIEYALAEVGY